MTTATSERMYRVPNSPSAGKLAAKIAEEHGIHYGWSGLNGDWFIGTANKLADIGVGCPTPCHSIALATAAE